MNHIHRGFIEPDLYFVKMRELISIAKEMQKELVKKNKKLRRFVYLFILTIYILISLLLLIGYSYFDAVFFIKLIYGIGFSIIFITLFSFVTLSISLNKEIKYKRRELTELMEVIFNLRKYAQPPKFDPIELTILDFELKRLQFF